MSKKAVANLMRKKCVPWKWQKQRNDYTKWKPAHYWWCKWVKKDKKAKERWQDFFKMSEEEVKERTEAMKEMNKGGKKEWKNKKSKD
jgi:hypothetical protein